MINISSTDTVSYSEVRRVFDLLDSFDVEAFGELLTDEVEVRFGNGPSMIGRPAVAEGQVGFFGAFKEMKHTLNPQSLWAKPGSFVIEGTATYTRHDDSSVSIPVADVFWLEGGKISKLFVFFDVAPLFALPTA